jgi:predicted RNase H-like HicB family nuclease
MEQEFTYTIEVRPADGNDKGFWVTVPVLPGCFTRGDTYDEAVENSRGAIEAYLDDLAERGEPIPIEDSPADIGSESPIA